MVPNLRFPNFCTPWKIIPISNLLQFQNGINGSPEQYGKGVKFISVGDILNNIYITYDNIKGLIDIDEKTLNNYSVTYGDILFQRSSELINDIGRTNVYLDKNNIATFGGFVIRGKKIGQYDPVFFNYLLKSPSSRKSIIRLGAGAQHYNIGQENIKTLNFYFPNETEQAKIASLFSKIDERIQTQIKIIDAYSSFIKAISNTLIGCKKENIEIGRCLDCYSSNIKEKDLELITSGNYPVYGANGCIKKISKYNISGSSIAIIKDGANVGKITKLNGKYSILSTMNYLTAKQGYDLNYLYYSLKQKSLKKYVVGSGIPHIYFKDYKQEKIYIPHDRFLIANITSLLTNIDEMIQIETKKLDKYKSQKQYLLKNMFI